MSATLTRRIKTVIVWWCGKWSGVIVAQRRFRHKTRKVPFLAAFWGVVVLHVVLVGAAAYTLFGGGAGR